MIWGLVCEDLAFGAAVVRRHADVELQLAWGLGVGVSGELPRSGAMEVEAVSIISQDATVGGRAWYKALDSPVLI